MSKIIIVKKNDGACDVIHPVIEMFNPESSIRQSIGDRLPANATDDDVLQYIFDKDVKGMSARITDKENIPSDRYFRNAWTDDNDTDTVDIDIVKAKEIKLNIFRQLRKPILENLDVEFMRAVEIDDKVMQKEISDKKQALRDVTLIELPNDVEQLKAFTPEILRS